MVHPMVWVAAPGDIPDSDNMLNLKVWVAAQGPLLKYMYLSVLVLNIDQNPSSDVISCHFPISGLWWSPDVVFLCAAGW